MKIYPTFSDAHVLPKVIQIENNLYVCAFKIMKLLPVKYMLKQALKRGEIQENSTIVDTSSGTLALGIGILCAELKLPFQIFGDPVIDQELLQRIEDLGGKITICINKTQDGAYQKQRLEALRNYLDRNPASFWLKQYDNPDHIHSYAVVADQLIKLLGTSINIIGTVGSGGSTCGIIKAIRRKNPLARLIGVDTFNSILFGLEDGQRILRGLGNSILPKNLDHTCYDEIHWVTAKDAYYYTRLLHKQRGLFYGPTSGAAYQVAKYIAAQNPNDNYVFIAADEGYRYLKTVYNDVWLNNQSFSNDPITLQPINVVSPKEAVLPWSCINWNRRTLDEMMRCP